MGGVAGTYHANHREKKIRKYDFRHPDKIGKDQIRELEVLYQHVSRLMSSYLSGRTRVAIEVCTGGLEQMAYEKYLENLPSVGIYTSVQMNPLPGNWLFFMDARIGFVLLDRLFGGQGDFLGELRPLTEIEQAVTGKFAMDLCSSLREAWHGVVEFEPVITGTASNPLFLQIAAPSDVIVVARLSIRIQQYKGPIEVCMPYSSLRGVIPRLSPQWAGPNQQGVGTSISRAVFTSLLDAPVEVSVVIGEGRITLSDLSDLEAGDVLYLDRRATDPSSVLIEGKPLFLGRPCRLGNTLSVMVTQPIKGATQAQLA